MKPGKPPPEQDDLLRARLVEMIDMRHELVKRAALIDWEVFERERAGLFYLQHAFRLSDEAVVARWSQNPYWQHFCGETLVGKTVPRTVFRSSSLQHRLPIDPASMTRWRNRLGPLLSGQVGRYAHARQFKRMRKALRRLKGYTGRVLRDIERRMDRVPEGALRSRLVETIALVNRLLAQKPEDRKKLLRRLRRRTQTDGVRGRNDPPDRFQMPSPPHVAQKARHSVIDGRTPQHPGDALSQRRRKKIEEPSGWAKTRTLHCGLDRIRAQFKMTMAACNPARLPKPMPA